MKRLELEYEHTSVPQRKDSRYSSDRSPHWIKSKNPNAPAVKREAEEDWGQKGAWRRPGWLKRGRVLSSRARIVLVVVLTGAGVVAGYFMAERWWGARERTPLAQICARVDYVNSLQQELPEQRAPSLVRLCGAFNSHVDFALKVDCFCQSNTPFGSLHYGDDHKNLGL
jgi:hypothetical protein